MSQESRRYGMGHLRESRGVDGLEVLADLRVIASDKEANKNLLWLLCDIDEELLSKVISVLQPFEDATSDKCPSLHLVTATKVHLQMHLISNGRDLAIIGQMKSHLMTQLLHYFTMSDIHAAATLLDSRLRNNTDVMTPDLKTRRISALQTSKNDDRMCAEQTRVS